MVSPVRPVRSFMNGGVAVRQAASDDYVDGAGWVAFDLSARVFQWTRPGGDSLKDAQSAASVRTTATRRSFDKMAQRRSVKGPETASTSMAELARPHPNEAVSEQRGGMSAVSKSIDLYPHDLLDCATEEASERRWWAVYTKSRQEKVFCRQLLGLQIAYYLPLVKKTSSSRGRRFSAQVPLFSGYVFLNGSEQDRAVALTTNRVSRILPVGDGDRLRKDLKQIFRLIASGAPVTLEERLAPGQRVRIRQGALAGLEGTVLERRGGRRLFVTVDFLQQGASIDLEDFDLLPID